MTLGPALFYIGLAIHAGKRFKRRPIGAILVFLSLVFNALGSFAFDSRMLIVIGHASLALGVSLLIFDKKHIENE